MEFFHSSDTRAQTPILADSEESRSENELQKMRGGGGELILCRKCKQYKLGRDEKQKDGQSAGAENVLKCGGV